MRRLRSRIQQKTTRLVLRSCAPENLNSKELVVPRPPSTRQPTSESERLARPLAGGGAARSAQPALGASQADGEQAALPAY
jgi:hypothetical protein